MNHKRSPLLVVSLTLALVLAACSDDPGDVTTTRAEGATTTPGDSSTVAGGATASISISDFSFSGPETVAVGTTVTVSNNDGVSHTWTSEDDVFDSEALGPGDTFEFTFDEPGEYPFFCSFHPGQMVGSITVEG